MIRRLVCLDAKSEGILAGIAAKGWNRSEFIRFLVLKYSTEAVSALESADIARATCIRKKQGVYGKPFTLMQSQPCQVVK